MGWHDVGGFAALDHDPVHLVEGVEVLAQESDGDLGHRQRICRVDTPFGIRGGVRLLAVVADLEMGHGQAVDVDAFLRAGVDHHGGVDAVKRAPVQHQDLAATALLGRCAQYPDGDTQVVCDRRQSHARAGSGSGDDVVAAGVADPGQRVVLGADSDGQRPAPRGSHKCRLQVAGALLDLKARPCEGVSHHFRGTPLLEPDLVGRMHAVAELDQRVTPRVDHLPKLILDRSHGEEE